MMREGHDGFPMKLGTAVVLQVGERDYRLLAGRTGHQRCIPDVRPLLAASMFPQQEFLWVWMEANLAMWAIHDLCLCRLTPESGRLAAGSV